MYEYKSLGNYSIGPKDSRVFLICLVSLLILSFGDMISTYLCISAGALEGNPIIASFFESYGNELGLLFMFGYQLSWFLSFLILPHIVNVFCLKISNDFAVDNYLAHYGQVAFVVICLYEFSLAIVNNFIIFFRII